MPTINPAGSPKVTEVRITGTAENASGNVTPLEFERFEELTAKLAALSESEVDAKRETS